MKSKKGKLKYLNLAKDVIEEGLQDMKSKKNVLTFDLKAILIKKKKVEVA